MSTKMTKERERLLGAPLFHQIGHRRDCNVVRAMQPASAKCNCYELSRKIPQ